MMLANGDNTDATGVAMAMLAAAAAANGGGAGGNQPAPFGAMPTTAFGASPHRQRRDSDTDQPKCSCCELFTTIVIKLSEILISVTLMLILLRNITGLEMIKQAFSFTEAASSARTWEEMTLRDYWVFGVLGVSGVASFMGICCHSPVCCLMLRQAEITGGVTCSLLQISALCVCITSWVFDTPSIIIISESIATLFESVSLCVLCFFLSLMSMMVSMLFRHLFRWILRIRYISRLFQVLLSVNTVLYTCESLLLFKVFFMYEAAAAAATAANQAQAEPNESFHSRWFGRKSSRSLRTLNSEMDSSSV